MPFSQTTQRRNPHATRLTQGQLSTSTPLPKDAKETRLLSDWARSHKIRVDKLESIGHGSTPYPININSDVQANGQIAIGASTSDYPLDVTTHITDAASYPYQAIASGSTGSDSGFFVSANFAQTIIVGGWILSSSDGRIKENIEPLSGAESLKKIKDVDVVSYDYIDKAKKDTRCSAGVIAQQVAEVIPEAVSRVKDFIPDVYRNIDCTWSKTGRFYNMECEDTDVDGEVMKFMAWNEGEGCKEFVVSRNPDGTYSFDKEYTEVFCYGRQIDDFHKVDKMKLFMLTLSATKELAKKVEAQGKEITRLEGLVGKKKKKDSWLG